MDDLEEQLEQPVPIERMMSPEMRRTLRRRWQHSLWRILPMPVLSYSIVGTYLWLARFEHPWWRAAVPVIAITIYTTFSPIIRTKWFSWMRQRYERGDFK